MAKKNIDFKKLKRDFLYGKPHEERRLGDLYIDKTGLYKHREWRGLNWIISIISGSITISTWSSMWPVLAAL